MRVLVVDDDLGSRLVAQAAVQALGHECVLASDGQEAWQLYLQWQPEVLLTDRTMPGMDGTQLCRAVRDVENGSYTYAILLSGRDEQADVLSGMESGADTYLTKPLDAFALQAALLAAARVSRLHEELNRARAELMAQAHTDPLTLLRNRLGLADYLEALHSTSQRYGRSYCLALCDIDLFKSYNDTYGHQAGDEALRTVGATLASLVRDSDQVYRYGGEEFLIALPEQEQGGAVQALNRIRKAVQGLRIAHREGGPSGYLTMSIGISEFVPMRSITSAKLLAEADLALYEAKAAGRNKVICAT
jgi:two-component system chemotaxis response regulator CheY